MFKPSGRFHWQVSHTTLPVADRIHDDLYRIYFGSRNADNKTQIGYAEIDFGDKVRVRNVSENPVVPLGPLGAFDDSGVFPSVVVTHKRKKLLYYVGWMEGRTVPYHASLGLAVSTDGGLTFQKFSRAPILERNSIDPFMHLSAWVTVERDVWRMWYTSCVGWRIEGRRPKPQYHIKYGESKDGVNWVRNGKVCIDFEHKDEWAIARPCVVREGSLYKMWYCYARSDMGYRIGYAESHDGMDWKRKDERAGIDVSSSGWDSRMIAYPCVIKLKDKYLMLYNGNGFVRHGIGYATSP